MVNFTFLIFELILAGQLADLHLTSRVMLWWMNGNFTFLPLQLILVDQLADLPPTIESSHGQFYISNI